MFFPKACYAETKLLYGLNGNLGEVCSRSKALHPIFLIPTALRSKTISEPQPLCLSHGSLPLKEQSNISKSNMLLPFHFGRDLQHASGLCTSQGRKTGKERLKGITRKSIQGIGMCLKNLFII
ncbi:uncharacterized [Tachysurus ichikawai]